MSKIKDSIRSIPDWPIPGVMFRDITTLLQDPEAFRESCDVLYNRYKDAGLDKVVAIDARGLVFGAVLAYKLNIGFVPVRKIGKLPHKTIQASYALEYGESAVEIHEDSIKKGEKVIIVDDLVATGGTLAAAVELVEKLGGDIVELACVIELPDLGGREKVKGHKLFSMIEFEGD